ncbi:hypothetical protein BMF94_2144 [Rhodotorula taiwanensis]|uniref:Uncharacterized protein n=1 Tax=Rhodotorula taiwanensis TaxID=741276 RepID=A0A2S5BDQ1_9BASI|nr:hypothetical protein BMF94_2144 [Rhodotorula taiwanensis]
MSLFRMRLARRTAKGSRQLSTVRVVPSTASRQLALPLAFVSVGPATRDPWQDWADRFAARGYSSLLLNVDDKIAREATTSQARLELLERGTSSSLALPRLCFSKRLLRDPATSSPFPPLLFAASHAALVAETYVSSHPLSALHLVSPLSAPLAHSRDPNRFPTALAEFDYEPGFPIAVMVEDGGRPGDEHRLLRDFVDDEEDDGLVRRLTGRRDEAGWERAMDWMDENGL